ncbi:3899_t:CDS:2, partial [Entrophospora sp. SA101]
RELEAVGIRLNKEKPNVYFKVKKGGGISFNATVKLNHLNEKMVYHILHDYKIFNAEVLVREDVTVDEFIDVVLGNQYPDFGSGLIVRRGATVEHVV